MNYNMERAKDMIHLRTLKHMSAHPGTEYADALDYVTKKLDEAVIKVERYNKADGTCDLNDSITGRRWTASCEPSGRKKPNEEQKSNREESNMQAQTYENAGQELDHKVKLHAAQHNLGYEAALQQVKILEPGLYYAYVCDETPLDREVREGSQEFEQYVEAYQSEFKLSRPEAVKRVGRDVPKVRVYAQDPFGPTRVRGETEPSPSARAAVPEWEPVSLTGPTALMEIATLLAHIPKDAAGNIPFDQAAKVLQAGYLDLLVKAAGEKLDALARAEIDIQGMPGFRSENYPQAFDAARRKYPALTQIYSGGRISAPGLRQLLPHFDFVD